MRRLSPERIAHVTALGQKMLDTHGAKQCEEGYGTTEPQWVGHAALGYGDINEDGTLN